jgi:hypothetical protein
LLTKAKFVYDNKANILLKGSIPIKDFLKAIKDNKIGLSTRKII